jgi:hypothetical protein
VGQLFSVPVAYVYQFVWCLNTVWFYQKKKKKEPVTISLSKEKKRTCNYLIARENNRGAIPRHAHLLLNAAWYTHH